MGDVQMKFSKFNSIQTLKFGPQMHIGTPLANKKKLVNKNVINGGGGLTPK
jgi:hypothetical protein